MNISFTVWKWEQVKTDPDMEVNAILWFGFPAETQSKKESVAKITHFHAVKLVFIFTFNNVDF